MSNQDFPDIPDFLRRDKNEPPEPKPQKRLRWTRDMRFAAPPTRQEEEATRKLRREIERQEAAKKAARLEALKQLKRSKSK